MGSPNYARKAGFLLTSILPYRTLNSENLKKKVIFLRKVSFFEYIPRGVNIFEKFKKLSSQI